MKLLLLRSLLLFLPLQTIAAEKVNIELGQVVTRVSNQNLSVYSGALKIYQAKEAIKVARMNLLPKLNVWRLAGAALDIVGGGASSNPISIGSGLLALVEDIAPFLIPANWLEAKKAKILYNADKEGYRALWANEVMNAKSLYLHILLDSELLTQIEKHQRDLNEISKIVKLRETLGGTDFGGSKELEIRSLALIDDMNSLRVLIAEEKGILAVMLGYSQNDELLLSSVEIPDIENQLPLDYSDFELRAVDTSPEIRQFTYFIDAAALVKKQALYTFLGRSSLSSGVGGGVFDNLPVQDGLGFGTGASMKIVAAQKEILKTQQLGAIEVVKRQLRALINNYNLDIGSFKSLNQRSALTSKIISQQIERSKLGQLITTPEMIEASKNTLLTEMSLLSVKYRFLFDEDRLARLIFHGDYSKQPIVIEKLKVTVAP